MKYIASVTLILGQGHLLLTNGISSIHKSSYVYSSYRNVQMWGQLQCLSCSAKGGKNSSGMVPLSPYSSAGTHVTEHCKDVFRYRRDCSLQKYRSHSSHNFRTVWPLFRPIIAGLMYGLRLLLFRQHPGQPALSIPAGMGRQLEALWIHV